MGWDSSEENKGIRLMKYFLLFLSVIYLKTSTFAQDQDQSPSKKVQYTPLPMIGSAPETGLQYGANLTTKFDLGSSQKSKTIVHFAYSFEHHKKSISRYFKTRDFH